MQKDLGGGLAFSAPEDAANADERSQSRWWVQLLLLVVYTKMMNYMRPV